MWLILKWFTILEDFILLDSVRYRDDVMMKLKFDWSKLKKLMSGWYRKLTSSCVSFTTYQQCHSDFEGDVTPILLQYQKMHWVNSLTVNRQLCKCICFSFKIAAGQSRIKWSSKQKLIYLSPMHPFYTPWCFQKVEKWCIGNNWVNTPSLHQSIKW